MKRKHHKINFLQLAMTLMLAIVTQSAWAQSTDDIGKVLGADGKMYKTVAAATNAGTTASGIIAYWGSAGSVESGNSSYRGMAIALEDAFLNWGSTPNHMEYCTSVSHQCSSATPYCSTVSSALNAINGIAATQSAQANNGEGHWHNAVWNSSGVARPSGASEWAIPSIGQWNLMVQGLTGNSSNLSDTDNPDYHFNNLSTKINAAGGTYLGWLFYWSSTEKDAGNAWCFNVGGLNGGRNGSRVSSFAKNHNDEYMHVRMFFAFSSATAAVYTISYNANGGSGAPSSQTKDGGIDIALSSTVPTRSGCTFTGWNTKADGSGTSYANGATFTGNANTTLYAQWTFQGSGTNENPYLIASTDHWNLLADKVNAGNTYSGIFFRLTNDISVTTMVGNSESNSFRGTFDGYGHTLTISYNTNSDYTAPFSYIQGATFKNLKVTGSITTTRNLAAGIAGLNTGSTASFDQCVTDVAINSSSTTIVGWGAYDYHGGFLARTTGVNVNLTDCVCGGSVDGSSASQAKGAGFIGLAENCTVTGTRCLSTTSYTNVLSWNSLCHSAGAARNASVFYYVNANDNESNVGTQITTQQLADGSYATNLQAGRPTTVWVQYLRTNQPMLKQFTKYTVTYHANGGSGSVPAAQDKQQGDDLMLSNSALTLSGFAQTGWNTNSEGTGTHYDLGDTYSADADVTLYAEWNFQGSGTPEDPYLIPSAEVWNFLADKVSAGNTYSGYFFRQTGDFTITRMVGTAINANGGNQEEAFKTFNGTYDGYGRTLTVNLNVTGERYAGPFHCVIGATIRNLIVTGSVSVSGGSNAEATRHPAALIGTSRDGSVLIENCRVSANVSGADYMGGILGHSWHANVTMTGCVYSGTLTANGTNYTGGLIGWGGDDQNNTFILTNNLFAGSYSGSGKFHPVGVLCTLTGNTRTVTNTYYTAGHVNMTDDDGNSLVKGLANKGKFAYSITGGTGVTVSNAGTPTTYYNVSDITSYGIGIKYGEVLYAGNGDAISLNLTATNHTGYSVYDFTASEGTLTGSGNPYSLIMPAANVTINARYSASKEITKYTSGANGWYLISSPIGTVSPENVTHMTENTYDIFRFNQNPVENGGNYLEWENWNEPNTGSVNHYHFDLEPGRGYLYANSQDVDLTFVGTPYSGNGVVNLEYSTTNPDSRMHGWNLIGNPFGTAATVDKASYKMNDDHNGFVSQVENASVGAMEGVFVQATDENQKATFTAQTRVTEPAAIAHTNIMVSDEKGKVLDNAIIRFDNGETLGKFQLRENSTKVYIPVEGKEYAIANADNDKQGEMPLNFKAEKNGSYTLSFSNENIEFGYLHLIDNLTGADIDLLQTPSYTFSAKTTDYESRFRLVFSANENENDNENENFAFIGSNGQLIVNGTGTIQIIDIMGRVIVTKSTEEHISTNRMTSGVYVLQLITATETKTQKIVVR